MATSIETDSKLILGYARNMYDIALKEDDRFEAFLKKQIDSAKNQLVEISALLDQIDKLLIYRAHKMHLNDLRHKWEDLEKGGLMARLTMMQIDNAQKKVLETAVTGNLNSAREELKAMILEFSRNVDMVTTTDLVISSIYSLKPSKGVDLFSILGRLNPKNAGSIFKVSNLMPSNVHEIYTILNVSLDKKIQSYNYTLVYWNAVMANIKNVTAEVNSAFEYKRRGEINLQKANIEQARTFLKAAIRNFTRLPRSVIETRFGKDLLEMSKELNDTIDDLVSHIS